MAKFEVRFSAGLPTSWPQDPPALRALPPGRELRLPLASSPTETPPESKSAQSLIDHGEPLVESASQRSFLARSPAEGRLIGPSQVLLTSGQTVPGVDVHPTELSPMEMPEDLPSEAMAMLGGIQPADLAPWIDRIRHAGIWADRLTSPDLIGQLHQLLRRPADTVICNLLDEDPLLRLASGIGARYAHSLLVGIGLLAKLTGARRVLLVVEGGSPSRWWRKLRRGAGQAGAQLVALRNDYPQADPTLLLYTLTRRRLKPARLPVEVGTLLLDAPAAVALGQCAASDRPMLTVPLGLFDHISHAAHYLSVPVGTSLHQVCAATGVKAQGMDLRAGYPLRDKRLSPAAVVAGGELTVHVMFPTTPANPQPCIRCAWCVEGCPVHIQPAGLLEAAQQQDESLAERFGLEACIECGICSYVCPSHLPLLGAVRKLRRTNS